MLCKVSKGEIKKHVQKIEVLREEEGRRKQLNLIPTESKVVSVQHFMYCLLFLVLSTPSSEGSHQLHSMKTFLIFTFLLTYSFFFCICNVINIHSLYITSVTSPSIGYTLCIQSTVVTHSSLITSLLLGNTSSYHIQHALIFPLKYNTQYSFHSTKMIDAYLYTQLFLILLPLLDLNWFYNPITPKLESLNLEANIHGLS